MPSVPSSPITPSRKRRSLRLSNRDVSRDSAVPSPYPSDGTNPTTFSRRSSRTSQTSCQPPSPTTPRPSSSLSYKQFSFHRRTSSRASVSSNFSLEQISGGGLGNLADELEDVWDDEQAEIQGGSFLDELREGAAEIQSFIGDVGSPTDMPDFEAPAPSPPVAMNDTLVPQEEHAGNSKRKKIRRIGRHQRTESQDDGSDYGPESDYDNECGVPPALARRIRDIESITRMSVNTEETLSEDGGIIKRTTEALKHLGQQSSIENGTSRLITAYSSLATHRTHKTRELFSQAHSLLYGNRIWDLPEEVISLLLSELDALAAAIPVQQPQNPLLSLQILGAHTGDMMHTLRALTDVLQESRVATSAASRKLKTVRDLVDDMQADDRLVETSMMLIHAGDWDRRCRDRHAARTCRDIVAGFHDVCDRATERLAQSLEA